MHRKELVKMWWEMYLDLFSAKSQLKMQQEIEQKDFFKMSPEPNPLVAR
jgi:hypothetical protein